MEAQSAKTKITPPGGEKKVHDELYSRALVIRSGSEVVAIASLDLLHIDRETTAKICRLVEERTGIPPDCLLLACSHTHHTGMVLPPLITPDGQGGFKNADRACADAMIEPIVAGVEKAYQNLVPAKINFGRSKFFTPHVVNDRFLLKDKTIAWWFDYTEEEIIAPTGPVDSEVGVLHVKGDGGETIAVLYNYSCHANAFRHSLDNARSADYPGLASEFIEKKLGGAALFVAGAAGDIHPVGCWWAARKDPSTNHKMVHAMGEGLGAVVEKAVRQMTDYRDDVSLRGAKRIVSLPLRKPGQREEEDMIRTLSREQLKDKRASMLARCRYVIRQAQARKCQTVDGIIQAIQIGEVTLVGIPGELFVEYGLEIKQRSCASRTFVATLANDSIGYMPTDTALRLGGYQTWPIWFENYPAPAVGRTIVEEMLRLVEEVIQSTVPHWRGCGHSPRWKGDVSRNGDRIII